MNIVRLLLAWLVAVGSAFADSSTAGGEVHIDPFEVARFSKNLERIVAGKGARVFIVARIGSPVSELPSGVRYTHTGFGVYSVIERNDGSRVPGYAIYNLYQDAKRPQRSRLMVDYPADFFASTTVLRAGIAIPSPDLQARLLRIIGTPRYARLHNPRYSILSNPTDFRYQNCNEFVLDVLQAAIYNTNDRHVIKANTAAYFKPQQLQIGGFTLLMGSIFRADVRTDDHRGPIATATFTTLVDYLTRFELVEETFEVTPQTPISAKVARDTKFNDL